MSVDVSAPDRPPARRKPKGMGADRRLEILDAAREIYLRDGYDQTTIRRVAQQVGVSSTALYVYFKDKDALIAALCDDILEPLHAAAEAMNEAIAVADTPEAVSALLRALSERYIAFGIAHPQVYFRVFMEPKPAVWNHRTGVYEAGDGYPSPQNAFLVAYNLIKRGQEVGLIGPGDPWCLAEVAWAALHGVVALRISDPGAPFAPIEDHARVVWEILSRGMAV